jgi:hypothetical protein
MGVDCLLTSQLVTVESPVKIYTALVSHVEITSATSLMLYLPT